MRSAIHAERTWEVQEISTSLAAFLGHKTHRFHFTTLDFVRSVKSSLCFVEVAEFDVDVDDKWMSFCHEFLQGKELVCNFIFREVQYPCLSPLTSFKSELWIWKGKSSYAQPPGQFYMCHLIYGQQWEILT